MRTLGVRDRRATNATKRPRAGACSSVTSGTAAATARARASARSDALSTTCRASAASASALSALRLREACKRRKPHDAHAAVLLSKLFSLQQPTVSIVRLRYRLRQRFDIGNPA